MRGFFILEYSDPATWIWSSTEAGYSEQAEKEPLGL